MKAYIYQLESSFKGCDDFYIGSTVNMKERKWAHKSNCNNVNNKKYNYKVYKYIRDTGGFNNWFMWILEEVEVESRKELTLIEGDYIRELKPELNFQIPGRTEKESQQEYRDTHKKEIKEHMKEYYEKHKEEINKKKTVKYECVCGGKYTKQNKSHHLKTKKHLKYMSNINVIKEI